MGAALWLVAFCYASGLRAQAPEAAGVPLSSRHWSYDVVELLEAAGAVPVGTSTVRPVPLGRMRETLHAVARDTALRRAFRQLAAGAAARYDEEFGAPNPRPRVGAHLRVGLQATAGDATEPSGPAAGTEIRVAGGPSGSFAFLDQGLGNGAQRPLLRRAGMGARVGNAWIAIGREAFRMGGGAGGSIVLSDAASLDGLLVSTPDAFRVPGAGKARIQVGLFRLSRYQAVDDPWFTTLRFSVQPAPWLHLAVQRAALFGGRFGGGRVPYDPKLYEPDSTSMTLGDVLGVLVGRNTTRDDQKAELEARASLAALGLPAVVYGELAFEDPDRSFGDPAVLAGMLLLARGAPAIALRYEYAAFGKAARLCGWCDTLPAYWYWHRRFQSGYTLDGQLLGHPLGGYGLQHLLEIRTLDPQARLRADARATLSRRDRWNLLEDRKPGTAVGAALHVVYRIRANLEGAIRASTERGRAGWRDSAVKLAGTLFLP